ncbi:MAG: hypothetical protein ACKVIG_08035 [Flavobacteriales bacterium]
MDHAIWNNHNHRFEDNYGAVLSSEGDYIVCKTDHSSFEKSEFEALPVDYSKMDYQHIQQIRMDVDPLPHWEEIAGLISTIHGETLRFILGTQITLKRFIRYELMCRGYDENFQWVGFDKAKEIWLK